MKQVYFALAVICVFSTSIFAQKANCGTHITEDQYKHLSQYQGLYSQVSATYKSTENPYMVPIKITVIRKSDGTGGMEEKKVYAEMHYLNEYFQEAGLQFFLAEEINFVASDKHYEFKEANEGQMAEKYDREKVINVYFVNSVTMANGSKICGYAYFPKGKDRMIIGAGCTYKATTLAHEMGHYFSLYHTHGIHFNDTEFADGTNCGSAGDEICDTPADPNLNGLVGQDCEYTGNQVDERGNRYNPDPKNIMSYANFNCRAYFTQEQNDRILFSYLNDRQYLSSQDTFATDFDVYSIQEAHVEIFPNPSNGLVTLAVKGQQITDFSIEVYNITGTRVFHQIFDREVNVENFQIDLTDLEKGMYIVNLTANREYITRKVLYQ